jgi:hypothetical protein
MCRALALDRQHEPKDGKGHEGPSDEQDPDPSLRRGWLDVPPRLGLRVATNGAHLLDEGPGGDAHEEDLPPRTAAHLHRNHRHTLPDQPDRRDRQSCPSDDRLAASASKLGQANEADDDEPQGRNRLDWHLINPQCEPEKADGD